MKTIFAKNYFIDPEWVHIISQESFSARIEEALLYAYDITKAHFGSWSHKVIQVSDYEFENMYPVEAGVYLMPLDKVFDIPAHNLTNTFLLSSKIHSEYQKHYNNPDEFKDLDSLIANFWEHHGLVHSFININGMIILEQDRDYQKKQGT